MKENEIVKAEPQSLSIFHLAIEKGYDLEQIEKMMQLKEKFDKLEAEKAFVRAMAEFKAEPLVITKDGFNKKYGSHYSTIGNIVNTVTPRMGECGLTHKWEIDQSNEAMIKITCIVTHEAGHSEQTSMSAPPDNSGSKNLIQEIKSTRTYLSSATFESLMGLASSNANINDDGNGAAGHPVTYLDDKQKGQVLDMIAEIITIDPQRDETSFINYMKVTSVDLIPANRFNQAMSCLKTTLSDVRKEVNHG